MHLSPIRLAIIHACKNINIETIRIIHHHSATLCLYQNSNSLSSQKANFKHTILTVFNTFNYSYSITIILQVNINSVFILSFI